jgi:membrane dipeptidase
MGHLAYYRALERQGHVRIITGAAQLDAHMDEWTTWDARAGDDGRAAGGPRGDGDISGAPPLGFVISMEGADPILEPGSLEEWWRAGLRLIGLTHYGPGRYAGGTGTEVGLTDLGIALLSEMMRLGVILDLSHCSDQAFWEAIERFDGPVIASHNNCRALVPHQRQLTDEQIKAIAARGGVIGAAMDNWMIAPGWRHGDSNESVRLEHAVRHIDYMCQLLGDARHVGIGSDLDGGFGREGSPYDLDTIADLQHVASLLAGRGYAGEDISAIMHGNWWSRLRGVWAHEE